MVIVEDVVTTGGSSLKAIERVEACGLMVQEVIAIVDRLEGGREAFGQRGYALRTLLTIRDFGIEPPPISVTVCNVWREVWRLRYIAN